MTVTIHWEMLATIGTWEVVKYDAIWVGKSRMLTAKMIGMTPAWLTRRGRKVEAPWYILRPRTRLAYWTGIRRWPSWMYTITATATRATIAKATNAIASGLAKNACIALGARLTMPAKMMKLIPLPMPFSVISSPSHISRIEPAVSETIWVIVSRSFRPNAPLRTGGFELCRTARKPYDWRRARGTAR